MTNEFRVHIDQFVNSLKENLPEIHYQAFDFTKINDSRTELTKLNYDKSKVSFLNLEMVGEEIFSHVISSVFNRNRLRICFKSSQQFIVLSNNHHREISLSKYPID